jgi:hypothetical protein
MEALLPGGAYANLNGSREALVAGHAYVIDYSSGITTTIYRPLSDVSAGNWTPSSGGSHYAMLNESSPDDGNYSQSGVNPTDDAMKVRFTSPGARPVNTGHIIRYRIKQQGGANMTVRLKQGVTTVASWTHTPAPVDWTTYERTLSEGEASSLTSGDPMDIETEAN